MRADLVFTVQVRPEANMSELHDNVSTIAERKWLYWAGMDPS
jgi:hypothetical protein